MTYRPPIICYVGGMPYRSDNPHEAMAVKLKPGDCISGMRLKKLTDREPYAGIVEYTSFYDGPSVRLRDGTWVHPSCGDTIVTAKVGDGT